MWGKKKKQLPKLPKGIVKPSIITGLEALGRGNDKNKIISFLTTIGNVLGPDLFGPDGFSPDAFALDRTWKARIWTRRIRTR